LGKANSRTRKRGYIFHQRPTCPKCEYVCMIFAFPDSQSLSLFPYLQKIFRKYDKCPLAHWKRQIKFSECCFFSCR
jgi:hypothetical protein